MFNKNYLRLFVLLALFSFQGIQGLSQEKQEPKKRPLPEISSKVYKKVSPVTVKIICNQGEKIGTGVIVAIGEKGEAIILTACHVVASNFGEMDPDLPLEFYQDIQVKISSELNPMAAAVIEKFVDRANDLAMISTTKSVTDQVVIGYSRSNKIKPGAVVAAVGFPGTDEPNLTIGTFNRSENKYLVFDAKIDQGSSGGPLIDKKGRMIGLSTFIIQGEEANEGYATHIDIIASIVDKWLSDVRLTKKWQLKEDKPIYKKPIFIIGGTLVTTSAILVASGIFSKDKAEGEFPLPPGRP